MSNDLEPQPEILQAALAGLLYDIGKFAMRAGERGSREWDSQTKQDYGYPYALLTADFIEECMPETWKTVVRSLAGHHHSPVTQQDRLIALANHLSAGARADPTDDTRVTHPRQLLSIFCSVNAEGGEAPQALHWPLRSLAISKDVLFPGQALDADRAWEQYEKMWRAFQVEARQLRDAHNHNGDLSTYLENMLLMMQRYTWCIPSAYYHTRSDISLYDHGRMTAALAAVLADSDLTSQQLERLNNAPQESNEPVTLLVGGDVSGVQSFIYTITARGATSALRGRSFYLQLITEAVTRYVLNRLKLPITNLIYAGGGNFYLLARPRDANRLEEIRRDLSRVLLYHHRGDLYMALASVPLAGKDFFDGRISRTWETLGGELQRVKQRRFVELGMELKAIFRPQGHGGNEERQCQVCGMEHPETKPDPKSITEENPEGVRKCPPCSSYEVLGEQLRNAQYLVLDQIEPPDTPMLDQEPVPGTWEDMLLSLGLKASPVESIKDIPAANGDRRTILALSDDALIDKQGNLILRPQARVAIGRRFLVNVTPTITEDEIQALKEKRVQDLPAAGSTKPFHAMEAQSQGIPRLGVLRMDVDNLGKLFSEGLGTQATLSRVAALSFAVSLYFEGWVEHLAAEQNADDVLAGWGERLYSIYSGGDDLFFVGSWDAIVELARRIRADLSEYAAQHPGIHASAGIALVGGKYPLYQAAQDAGHAEELAKGLQWVEGGRPHKKDAIAFLGQALPWEKFGLEPCKESGIKSAHALMHLLVDVMGNPAEGKASPHALLRRLINLHERYLEAAEKRRQAGKDQNRAGQEQVLWGPWMWLGFYTLTRMTRQTGDQNIQQLRDRLKADNFRSMEWIGLAARWAELSLRKTG